MKWALARTTINKQSREAATHQPKKMDTWKFFELLLGLHFLKKVEAEKELKKLFWRNPNIFGCNPKVRARTQKFWLHFFCRLVLTRLKKKILLPVGIFFFILFLSKSWSVNKKRTSLWNPLRHTIFSEQQYSRLIERKKTKFLEYYWRNKNVVFRISNICRNN